MIPRLPTAALETAITSRIPLNRLCAEPCTLLDDLRVADYIGSYRIRQTRHGEHDLIAASAQVFFEEDGAFCARHDGAAHQRPYAVVIFATFLVVEFNPFTPEAHFLVLAPVLEADDSARYQGLWAAQRIERLQLALREADGEAKLFDELDRALAALRRMASTPAPEQPGRRHWLARLFGAR